MQKGSWRENVYVNTFFKLKTQVSEIHFEMLFPYICRVDILHTNWEQHKFHAPSWSFRTYGFWITFVKTNSIFSDEMFYGGLGCRS